MIKITVSDVTLIEGELPQEVLLYLNQRLTFVNPQFKAAEKQGRWLKNIPQTLSFIKKTSQGIEIPRGFTAQLLKTLRYNQAAYKVSENTRLLEEYPFQFHGKLHSFQENAANAILTKRFGVLNSPTGSGKTVITLYTIANRKQPALVICHTKELLYQWRDRALEFLQLPEDEIGLIGDGKKEIGKPLTIAIINSLYKCIDEVRDHIGFFVVDECHRVAGRTFTEAVSSLDARYMLGLSATAYRRDGLSKVIYFYMGDKVFEISPQELQKINKIMVAHLIVKETGFSSYLDGSTEYQALIGELTENTLRNELIISNVVEEAAREEGICLVLSDRKEHCQKLYELLVPHGIPVELLTGSTPKKQRESIIKDLDQGLIKILVATGGLIGEGFDCKKLNSLFMATPVKFTGRITQYLGRILRTAEGKSQPKVYDYLDEPAVLQYSFKSRCRAYQNMSVILPENFNKLDLL